MPATGFSIGVSRLQAALSALGRLEGGKVPGPVVVLIMDRERIADYQGMAGELRQAGIRAEIYLGGAGMKAQMRYADRRGAPCVIIQGSDEHARGVVQIKNLAEGARLAATIDSHEAWREARPAQFEVAREELVAAVGRLLDAESGPAGP